METEVVFRLYRKKLDNVVPASYKDKKTGESKNDGSIIEWEIEPLNKQIKIKMEGDDIPTIIGEARKIAFKKINKKFSGCRPIFQEVVDLHSRRALTP
jgi:hypothetical protein